MIVVLTRLIKEKHTTITATINNNPKAVSYTHLDPDCMGIDFADGTYTHLLETEAAVP